MASLKIILYETGKLKDGRIPIMLRLIIDRKSKYYSPGTTLKCFKEQWDNEQKEFRKNFQNYKKANRNIHAFFNKAEDIILELEKENKTFTHDEFEKLFFNEEKRLFVLSYFEEQIKRMENTGNIGNATVYNTCKRKLKAFFNKDLEIHELTPKNLKLFIENCEKDELKPNSINNYLRTLRALCNKAIKEEGIKYYPFKSFNWKPYKNETKKLAISKSDMMKINKYEAPEGTSVFNSIKYFTFSYHTYGLNFRDLVKLTRENITEINGQKFLEYFRSKTGKLYEIPLAKPAQDILDYYINTYPGQKYIFPILHEEIHDSPKKIFTRSQTALKIFNDDIKKVATELGITGKITSYVARHTFATVLYKEKESVSMIGEMMGHSSPITTMTYLKRFDPSEKIEASKKLTE